MYSSYMQGGMNSGISPDESTKPDDSKTLLFVPKSQKSRLERMRSTRRELTSALNIWTHIPTSERILVSETPFS